jgi:hypothetical protein
MTSRGVVRCVGVLDAGRVGAAARDRATIREWVEPGSESLDVRAQAATVALSGCQTTIRTTDQKRSGRRALIDRQRSSCREKGGLGRGDLV